MAEQRIDLSKLTPAPWDTVGGDVFSTWKPGGETVICDAGLKDDDAGFVALARNAFDVMMRRGWNPERNRSGGWSVSQSSNDKFWMSPRSWPDPFTALVEADRWYRENVESKGG